MSDRFGTTPLPISRDFETSTTSIPLTPIEVTYDPSSSNIAPSSVQQPVQQEFASFVAERADYTLHGASIIAVNSNFIVYAVKNGLIRVLSRHSTQKTLLRMHKDEVVSDIQFFHDGEFLATVGATKDKHSRVVVWRIYHRSDSTESVIVADPMLEIRSLLIKMIRVVWHPYNPNQFFIIHHCFSQGPAASSRENDTMISASLIETTKITTRHEEGQSHAVADLASYSGLQQNGLVTVIKRGGARLQDLAWSGVDSNCVLAGYDNGDLVFYTLSSSSPSNNPQPGQMLGSTEATVLHVLHQESPVLRCLFLPHYDAVTYNHHPKSIDQGHVAYTTCFVTGSGNDNSTLTIWSAYTSQSKPMIIQIIRIASSPTDTLRSYVLNTCYGPSAPSVTTPPSCFIIACCRDYGTIYAFHMQAQWSQHDNQQSKKILLVGSNYVVPFTTKYPILSCTITCAPSSSSDEDDMDNESSINFDMKLFTYQTAAAQCLQLTSNMCMPPTTVYSDSTLGVTVTQRKSLGSKDVVAEESAMVTLDIYDDEFEDYEVEEMEDNLECNDDLTSLPIPLSNVVSGSSTNINDNPFANWLGTLAITTKTPIVTIAPPTPIPVTNATPKSIQVATKPTASQHPDITTLLSPMEILGLIPVGSTNTTRKVEAIQSNDSVVVPPRTAGVKGNDLQQRQSVASQSNRNVIPDGELTTSSTNGSNRLSIESDIRLILKEELGPSIRREMDGLMQPIVDLLQPMQSKIDEFAAQQQQHNRNQSIESEGITAAVTANIEDGVKAMFTECMRTVLIPTIESVASQIFAKVSDQLDAKKGDDNRKLELITQQLATTLSVIGELTKEVTALRDKMSKNSSVMETVGIPALVAASKERDIDPYDKQRNEILGFIKDGNYEFAFRRAVSIKTVDIVLFCCRSVDIHDVFGNSERKVTQPILLCLMQQLSTILDTSPDPQFVVDWLEEITIAMYPPVDPQIKPHLPGVVQKLDSNLMKCIARTNIDPTLRRSLKKLHSLLQGIH